MTAFLRLAEVMLLRYRGDLPEAIEGLRSIRTWASLKGNLQGLALVDEALAGVYVWEEVGEKDEDAETILQEALDLRRRGLGRAVLTCCLLSLLRARQGEPEAARHLLAEAREQAAERDGTAYWEPNLLWAEANLAMAEGHWSEALAAFEATVDTLGQTNLRWRRARTLVDWAEAHLARGEPGDRERGLELLREAEAEFEAMGAHGYVDRVKGRLEELDGGSATV
jgi:hypothetical protein